MYKWEKESLSKYGEEVTLNLIEQQKQYEETEKHNNCEGCGKDNEGAIAELKSGKPFILHYGLWANGRCTFCGKHE